MHIIPLFVILKADNTSPQTLMDLLGLAKAADKVLLVVRSYHGFAVNHLFFFYLITTTLLIHLGLNLYRVDVVIKELGMPMSPLSMICTSTLCY